MTTETLNTIEGVQCNEVMGAMYAFPRIFLPGKAVAEAKVSVSSLSLSLFQLLSALFNAKGSWTVLAVTFTQICVVASHVRRESWHCGASDSQLRHHAFRFW